MDWSHNHGYLSCHAKEGIHHQNTPFQATGGFNVRTLSYYLLWVHWVAVNMTWTLLMFNSIFTEFHILLRLWISCMICISSSAAKYIATEWMPRQTKLPTVPEMDPYKGTGVISTLFFAKKTLPVQTKVFQSQTIQLPNVKHVMTMPTFSNCESRNAAMRNGTRNGSNVVSHRKLYRNDAGSHDQR